MGAQVRYSDELGAEIAERFGEAVDPLHQLCDSHDHWPSYQTLLGWERRQATFKRMMRTARRAHADRLVLEAIDDLEGEQVTGLAPGEGSALVAKHRQLITAKLAAAKRHSPDWHDKTTHQITTEDGEQERVVDFSKLEPEQLRQLLHLSKQVRVDDESEAASQLAS